MPDLTTEQIIRERFHGLYLSRKCPDITDLSRELLGLHCWFHRNVVFSALIRGSDITGWKHALTKTWLYRGTLHGVFHGDLAKLLSLHKRESWIARYFSKEMLDDFAEKVLRCMEDGVSSRAEMRKIFSEEYEPNVIENMFSPWGGIFVYLAGQGKVAFRDMTSRDFDLIDAEPVYETSEILTETLERYFAAYGPATADDAAWFFGFGKEFNTSDKPLKAYIEEYGQKYGTFTHEKKTYYRRNSDNSEMNDIPEFTLLSGFDPVIVSYTERGSVLPPEYKKKVILKSGICLPTIAVNGKVAGLWNIKNNEPFVEFFGEQPKRITNGVLEAVEKIRTYTVLGNK